MSVREFSVHTEVVTGLGSLDQLPRLLERLEVRRVAVAVDEALAQSGLLQFVLNHASGVDPVSLVTFPANPDVSDVERGAGEARSAEADAVIAIGGGSALGGGKAIAIRLCNDAPITAFEGVDRVPNKPAPTIAIPTTAGSGSEVSNALVLHEAGRTTELVVRGRGLEPRAAILDARVLRTLPRSPLLYAGLDALTHAMEALWTHGGTFFSTGLALHAADRILTLLPHAVAGVSGENADGANDEVLQELLEASAAANMACGNSGLGLVHALSSSPQVKLAHGLQNGVLLPRVAAFNALLLDSTAHELVSRIERLYEAVEFDPDFTRLSAVPVPAPGMVAATHDHPFRTNNIRPSSDEELLELVIAAGATAASAIETPEG